MSTSRLKKLLAGLALATSTYFGYNLIPKKPVLKNPPKLHVATEQVQKIENSQYYAHPGFIQRPRVHTVIEAIRYCDYDSLVNSLKKGYDSNYRNKDGFFPAAVAVKNNDIKALKILDKYNCNLNNRIYVNVHGLAIPFSLVEYAIYNNADEGTIRYLLNKGVKPVIGKGIEWLISFAYMRNLKIGHNLLKKYIDVVNPNEIVTSSSITFAQIIANRGTYDDFKLLITKKNVDTRHIDGNDRGMLDFAVLNKHTKEALKISKYLVDVTGVDPNNRRNGQTSLDLLIYENSSRVAYDTENLSDIVYSPVPDDAGGDKSLLVKFLLSRGATSVDPNIVSDAMDDLDVSDEIIELLIKNNFKIDDKQSLIKSAVKRNRSTKLIRLLLTHGYIPNEYDLGEALNAHKFEVADIIIKSGNINGNNLHDYLNDTLYNATTSDDKIVFSFLTRQGAEIDNKIVNSVIKCGCENVANLLIKKGYISEQDIEERYDKIKNGAIKKLQTESNNMAKTLEELLSYEGSYENVFRDVLDSMPNLRLSSGTLKSLISYAADYYDSQNPNSELNTRINELAEKVTMVDSRNMEDMLSNAISTGDAKLVKTILEHTGGYEEPKAIGNGAVKYKLISLAAEKNESLAYMLEEYFGIDEDTAIHNYIEHGILESEKDVSVNGYISDEQLVKLKRFVKYISAQDMIDPNLPTMVKTIIESDTIESYTLVYTLLEKGMNPNIIIDKDRGTTIIMFATKKGRFDIIDALIQFGANPFITDKLGKNMFDYFIDYNEAQKIYSQKNDTNGLLKMRGIYETYGPSRDLDQHGIIESGKLSYKNRDNVKKGRGPGKLKSW